MPRREALEKEIYPYLASNLRSYLKEIPNLLLDEVQEVRLRVKKPLVLVLGQGDYLSDYLVQEEDLEKTLQLMSRSSLYALEEELKNGYLTLPGGHRVGVVGKGVLDQGRIRTLKNISGFNIRISQEIRGAADKILPYLVNFSQQEVYHTLVISPPQGGKTTLLRDIARQLSDGFANFPGLKIGIVDERSEIAACYEGIPQRDVGLRTDILDACPKAEGMMLLVRSMSPQVIITDEVGRMEDIEAMEEAINSGVKIITSVHGSSLMDLEKRPSLSRILSRKIFERLIFLGRSAGVGTVEKILDGEGNLLANNLMTVRGRGNKCG